MRLILTNHSLPLRTLPAPPEGTFGFVCFEDYSVGPLSGWEDPAQFQRERSAFWATTSLLTLPDGQSMEYFVWHQILPSLDIADPDPPECQDVEALAPRADIIEIWADMSVRDQVWQWRLMAEFARMGIDRRRLFRCHFKDGVRAPQDPAFWHAMIADAPDRPLRAMAAPDAQVDRMCGLWRAAAALPAPVDATIAQDAATRHVLDVLAGRHPDPRTGLNNLRRRLLRVARPDWTKMARTIADAMVIGLDERDSVGDAVLQAELESMARMDPALVDIDGAGAMRNCAVRLTAQGAALRGRLDA